MIKFVTFASEIRLNALLCSSAAVLLTACGGGNDLDTPSSPPQASQTASEIVSREAAAAPDAVAAAPVEQSEVRADEAEAVSDVPADFSFAGYSAQGEPGDIAADAGEPEKGAGPPPIGAEAGVADTQALQADGVRSVALGDQGMADAAAARPKPAPAPKPGNALSYYVATNGKDTAAGTSASAPFKTLARAASAATRAGATVYVAPGTYEGGFKTTASGSANARIKWVSTTKWGARIVPPAKSSNNNAWDNRGSYVTIVGFDIDGSTSRAGTKWTHGIYSAGSYDQILENRVHHIAKSVPCNSAGGSAIGVDSYFKGIKSDVIGNIVYDIGPAGCRFVQGIYVSTSGTVKNNVVYRVSEAAIHLWHDATNVIITNNTVAASGTGIIVGGGDYYHIKGPNDNTAVYSNIVYDNKYGISEQGRTGKKNTYRNNLVFQNTYNWTLKNGLQHSATVTSAPYFSNYTRTGTPNFKPTPSSPAIGRGSSAFAHATDFAGKPRNAKTGFDIGAYQH
jgi:hypothetical protein